MMAEENYVFLWLLLILLGYAWIRFLLRQMLKRPVFEKFEATLNDHRLKAGGLSGLKSTPAPERRISG